MTPDASNLNALVDAHLLSAGPVLGAVGWALLWVRRLDRGWRTYGALALAKGLSTALWVFPLGLLFQAWIPRHLGADPLVRLPWALGTLGLAQLVGSMLLEAPFFRRAGRNLAWGKAVGLSLQANAVCLLLLVALYLPFCRLSLLATGHGRTGPRPEEGVRVFYLRDGTLFEQRLEGTERRLAALDFPEDARIFARRGPAGWDLWIQARDRSPRRIWGSVAGAEALAPAQLALQVKLKAGVRTSEPAWPETYGKPAEALPEGEAAWSVQVGRWPREGLRVESRDLGGAYDLALDTPFMTWAPRCATRLPGDRLIFQMGSYLWLLELETKGLRCLGKGQGAQVVLSGVGRSSDSGGNP